MQGGRSDAGANPIANGGVAGLDVQGLRKLPVDWGQFNTESLCVRYNFTLAELHASLAQFAPGREIGEPVRTVLHETMHLFHNTTTPFGFYIYALRRAQTSLVIELIGMLRQADVRIRFPLATLVARLPGQTRERAEPYLKLWYGIELFILLLFGDRKAVTRHFLNNPYARGLTFAQLHHDVNEYLAWQYRFNAQLLERLGRIAPGQADALPAEPTEVQPVPDGALESMLVALLFTGEHLNVNGVIESAGTAAEFWGSPGADIESFRAQFAGPFPVERWMNTELLGKAAQSIPATNGTALVASYLALCEVALFPPILPQHRALHSGALDVLLPHLRIRRLLEAAQHVRPLDGDADYVRYTDELCAALGWPSPAQIVDRTLSSHQAALGDAREELYVKAQLWRKRMPYLFANPANHIIAAAHPAMMQWVSDYHFPVVLYSDRSTFHADKEYARGTVRDHLLRRMIRRILLRRDLVLPAPFTMTDDMRQYFVADLVSTLEPMLAIRVQGVQLV